MFINKPLQVLGPGAAAASAAVPEKKGLDAAQATKRLMAIVGSARTGRGVEKWGEFSAQNGGWLVVTGT